MQNPQHAGELMRQREARLPEAQRQEERLKRRIAGMLRSLVPLHEIVARLGVKRSLVNEVQKAEAAFGRVPNPRPPAVKVTDELRAKVIELAKAGQTFPCIAKACGAAECTVQKIVAAHEKATHELIPRAESRPRKKSTAFRKRFKEGGDEKPRA